MELSNVQTITYSSPLGPLTLWLREGVAIRLDWRLPPSESMAAAEQEEKAGKQWLEDYFARRFRHFPLPIAPHGTRFQQRSWEWLVANVAPGQTVTYGSMARALATSPRAIGNAMAANPLPLIIPCHRVVGVKGLTGYSGHGGVASKQLLLELERADAKS